MKKPSQVTQHFFGVFDKVVHSVMFAASSSCLALLISEPQKNSLNDTNGALEIDTPDKEAKKGLNVLITHV